MIDVDEWGLPDSASIDATGRSVLELADALVSFGEAITKAAYPDLAINALCNLSRDETKPI